MKHAYGFTDAPVESGLLILLAVILGLLTGWFLIILCAYLATGVICLFFKYEPPEADRPYHSMSPISTTQGMAAG